MPSVRVFGHLGPGWRPVNKRKAASGGTGAACSRARVPLHLRSH
jgi:hypothetical protein